MENLIKATERLINAIKKLHVELNMGIPEHEECYMALHDCRKIIEQTRAEAKTNNENSALNLADVSGSLPSDEVIISMANNESCQFDTMQDKTKYEHGYIDGARMIKNSIGNNR